ncbi:MAG: citrate synthase [Planctomycetes bacterium]|nr:citrate synthase [Planctomycetota bacterium]
MEQDVQITVDGKSIMLPVVTGSENEKAVDIGRFRAETGYVTLDPGYVNTGSCTSSICYIDGDKGILRYRGYPIEELAEGADFMEVSYLLLNGELPTSQELEHFNRQIVRHSLLHEDMKHFFDAVSSYAHPMAVLAAMVCNLSSYYPADQDPNDPAHREMSILRLLAKLPTIAALSHKKSIGQPVIYPRNDLNYCENFLHMMFAVPCEPYEVKKELAEALNLILILHADHEQNCSTSTVRVVGSSDANLYASVAAGICALWGPLHGGANQKVIEMLGQIQDSKLGCKGFIDKVKDKNSGVRLMGFGHRVYKNFDPRARIIKKACDRVLDTLGIDDPLLEIAKELEQAALKDEYFIERKLYPNVDFYSGIIYRAMGIPTGMFTVMFALGRLPGWMAHWKEMHELPGRISRPRQIYTGPTQRAFVPIKQRS